MAVKKRTPGEIQNYAVSLATNPNLSGPGKEIAKMLLETQAALKETKRQAGLVEIDRRKLQSRAGKQKQIGRAHV